MKSGHITIKASLVKDHSSEPFIRNFFYTNVKISVVDSSEIGIKEKYLKKLNDMNFNEKNNDFFSNN
jgi:hypothetical protein